MDRSTSSAFCLDVNPCLAVDKEKVSCIQNGHYGYIDFEQFFAIMSM